MQFDMTWFNNQVQGFEKQRQIYLDFVGTLKPILEQAVRSMGISAIVQARTKEVPSFAEKCIRKRDLIVDPVHLFTDLCGARVIVESKDQIEPVCNYIRTYFEIDEANSEDVIERLRAYEFGYLSVHFIVSFKEGKEYLERYNIPEKLLERRDDKEASKTGLPVGPKYKAEIQVRTLLQHAWATLTHDNLYKPHFKVPRHLDREAGRIAALLEDADESFVRLLQGVNFYRSDYGAYMSPERIHEEIEILETVRCYDAENEKLALQIARMAMAVENWHKAIEILDRFKPSGRASLLRDLGIAKWKQGDADGLGLLEEATNREPDDPDAQCALGDIWFAKKEKARALRYYERAFKAAPTYPRALRSFLQCKLVLDRNLDFLSLMRPSLGEAMKVCRQWARVGVHLPWAYYDMGFFALLLGRTYESLAAFGKAVELSATESPLEENCRLLEELQEALKGRSPKLEVCLECATRFFLVATVGKLWSLKELAHDEAERAEAAAGKAEEELKQLQKAPDVDEESLKKGRETAESAKTAAQKAKQELKHLSEKAGDAPFRYLANIDPQLEGKRYLATRRQEGEEPIFDKKQPVLIVAGGCDASVAQRIGEYRYIIERALDGFQGTIISGGTTAGISGIVGDLPDPQNKITKVAYLPRSLPRGDIQHSGYTIYETPGTDYGPLLSIQGWIDLLVSGIRPDMVRLIGINGGDLSAFEYRLGLVMGSNVGILRDSGREATRISEDLDWRSNPCLILLPTDEETVRLFLQPPPPSKTIKAEHREALARRTHEKYREDRSYVLISIDAAMADWEQLSSSLKRSNYQMVDNMEAKLSRIGLRVRPVAEREVKFYRFNKEQVETLAEMEHARWNVERLLDGWQLGERDHAKKTTPYLLPWGELADDVKEWDRETIINMPRFLKDCGYEIYEPKEG